MSGMCVFVVCVSTMFFCLFVRYLLQKGERLLHCYGTRKETEKIMSDLHSTYAHTY